MGIYSQAKTITFIRGLSTVKHKTVIRDATLTKQITTLPAYCSAFKLFFVTDPLNEDD